VEDDGAVIGSQPEIAFNSGAQFQCRSEGGQAVFGKARAVMQAAVCETRSAGVEWIRL
jgi:hypothetical protein